MTDSLQTLDRVVGSLPGAERRYPFESRPDLTVFVVHGLWFAWLNPKDRLLTLKCDPDISVSLQNTWPAITPGYHMNKRHWISIALDGTVPDELIATLLEEAHSLIVTRLPREVRIGLLGDADR